MRAYIPRGNTLDAATFGRRHELLCWILAGHVPALCAYALWQGFGVVHALGEVSPPVVALGIAQAVQRRNRRIAALMVTAGLVFCSSALVHLSGGTIEAHFHFFVLIGLIALYQDWVPFLWNVVFTVVSHGAGSALGSDLMYNHAAAQNRPWSWAVIHGAAVLAACVGVVVFWKNTELEQQRSTVLATDLAAAQAAAAHRHSVAQLFVSLARRNQSLLDRQLELITELERMSPDSEALGGLFKLDHLATRIRRNAESLLVLAGDESPRRWGHPLPLVEVARAAAAEVEDYRRVDVQVSEHLELVGQAAADLAHLLAELIENATLFSPPSSGVRVCGYPVPGERPPYVVSVEDHGIGMHDDDQRAVNELFANPPDLDLEGNRLGFHVVARLARRHGARVSVTSTPGGGLTAQVMLPNGLVGERPRPDRELVPTELASPSPRPQAVPVAAALGPATGPSSPSRPSPARRPVDRDRMRSMLTRFQAGQRAGRAIAEAQPGSLRARSGPLPRR